MNASNEWRPGESSAESGDPAATIERAFREEQGAVLATLIRHLGDFQLAEDAVQDAFAAAVATWPRDGVPANPGAASAPRPTAPRGWRSSRGWTLRSTARRVRTARSPMTGCA
jgi:hypothetical protein